jgi:hypothetical protein
MMRKLRFAPLAFFALFLAGCADTMDSLAREMRNANNEAIDALMLITDADQAKRVETRVLKPLAERYQNIDGRLDVWAANRTKKDRAAEIQASAGYDLFMAELPTNKKRFDLEQARLRDLYEKSVKKARDDGIDDAQAGARLASLKMLATQNGLDFINKQLSEPKLGQLAGR